MLTERVLVFGFGFGGCSVAAFVASVTWIVFASLLYITENKNTTEDADRWLTHPSPPAPSTPFSPLHAQKYPSNPNPTQPPQHTTKKN